MRMNEPFIFLLMIFCHIIDDYVLQGWLASAKQKDWWKKNAPDELYQYDWSCALLMHSLSWAFMIMLPIAIVQDFYIDERFLYMFIFNTTAHAFIDDLKANRGQINLWLDQLLHIGQIMLTLWILIGV